MKKVFLALSGCALLALGASAQQLKDGYITMPSGANLHDFAKTWSKSNPNLTTVDGTANGETWDDQNFFISRVKIKPYFRNANTQVFDNITESNDKKLLFWVPAGDNNVNGVHTGALPNGVYDSEVFSMWPYVTYFGDWISPFGFIPGGFADAAHKHGTAVGGQASIPNASLSGNWYTCIKGIGDLTDAQADNLADFLHYHGVDGLNCNSEFSTTQAIVTNLTNVYGKVYKRMHEVYGNDKFENIWYTGTVSSGSINFMSALHSGNTSIFGTSSNPKTSLFVNYEWLSYITTTANSLPSTGRDGRDLYMGMNMQAGCKQDGEWLRHKQTNYSIGLWGAHDFNYLWAPRANNGSSDDSKQVYYQQRLEEWFTNGNRNPANRIDVYATKVLGPSAEWFGMSQFMSARSTLSWDLADEPFVSFFNLGNGKFYNWKGQRSSNTPWYNIGVQDYMPTWRFWFATSVLGNTAADVEENGLKAEFTWDDAYVGGSCLRVHGSSADEYLHLFKTQFTLSEGDVITVRYKLLEGHSDINLLLTAEGGEQFPLAEDYLSVVGYDDMADDGEWYVKQFTVTDDLGELIGSTVALAGFHFQNSDNLDLLLGEFSIKKGNATATPAAPVIDKTKTKVLANNMSGVDGKVIFNMPNTKASGEPVYNVDVNASMFKLYAQFENGAIQNTGITSSWAGMYFAVKPDVDNTNAKVRFGVSAVSLDTDSESEIAWSDYMSLTSYETTDGIEIDKQVIKPGESFTVKYTDPRHAAGTFTIYNSQNQKVASSNGEVVSYTCEGLNDIDGYDVVVNEGKADAHRYVYLIQVSPTSIGALPEIETLTVNGVDAEADNAEVKFRINDSFKLGYTGREANGSSSRGVKIDNNFVGGPINQLGLTGGAKSFSVAAWVKYDYPSGSSRMFGIEDRTGSWPSNNWGWCWFNVSGADTETPGAVENLTFRSSFTNGSPELKYTYNTVVPQGAWTHIVYTFEWNSSNQFRAKFYVNGVRQVPTSVSYNGSNGNEDTFWSCTNKAVLTNGMWFYLAGGAGSSPVYNDGVVDDVVIWDGAMTEAEVQQVMSGVDASNSKVIGYWDFETDAAANNTFKAKGTKSGAEFSNFALLATENEGQATQTPVAPNYEAGSPFISGTAYVVETTPTWTARRIATVEDATGNDKAGSVNVSFPREGNYTVKLALENSYGSDEKEYPVFTIDNGLMGIEDVVVDGETLEAYTIDGTLFVEFAADGNYTVNVYGVNGQLVGKKTQNIVAGQNMSITLANAGVYVVNVVKDGKVLRNIKVLNQK